jgi:hypothetical protein
VDFLSLLAAVAPVFLIIGVGFGIRRLEWLSAEADASLLRIVVNLLFPCLILDTILGNEAMRQAGNLVLAFHRDIAHQLEILRKDHQERCRRGESFVPKLKLLIDTADGSDISCHRPNILAIERVVFVPRVALGFSDLRSGCTNETTST